MKRRLLLTAMLFVTIMFTVMAQTATAPSVGDGTSGNPYQIATLDNLYWITQNSAEWGKYYIQTADIDATSTNTWDVGDHDGNGGTPDEEMGFSPIGNATTKFTGSYNGQGHTIDGIFINRPSTDNVGLFGYINGASVDDIGVTNTNILGRNYVGGISAVNISNSTISNSYSTGSVTGGIRVGGFIGYILSSSVSNCYSMSSVSGTNIVGGLIGHNNNNSSIINSYCTGLVSGNNNVGSLTGLSEATSTTTNSFWDTETSGQATSAGGTGKTTAEMQDITTFTDAGWDFVDETTNGTDDYWDLNCGYPYLSWQSSFEIPTPVGAGTEDDPYQIATLCNLRWLSETDTVWDKYFIQTTDINAAETQNWNISGTDTLGFSPIGNSTTEFTGSYNGQGYIIDSLFINRPTHNNGLFGYVVSSTIDSLGVTNANITGNNATACVIGWNGGILENSFSSGIIKGASYSGGLVGSNYSAINNSYSFANIDGGNNGAIGGLVGSCKGTINNSYSTGTTLGNSSSTGGLVGYMQDGATITNSFWDTETSGQATSAGGTGKTTAKMQTMCTYVDGTDASWDFIDEATNGTDDIWGINADENGGYPFLSWQGIEHTGFCGISDSEFNAIKALYKTTDGDNWTNNTGWDTTLTAFDVTSDWKGLTVADGHITRLELQSNNLTGTIPTNIGDLTSLTYLSLYLNNITGSIPTEIGNLTNLTTIYLYNNDLTGNLPSEVGSLINLTNLNLSNNNLSGTIPTEINGLISLVNFAINNNQLTGEIPFEIGNLINLKNLFLDNNQLTGEIPSNIWDLVNLTYLRLRGNLLTGSIPSEIENLTNLQYLYLGQNDLDGTIPPEIGNLTNLKLLDLYDAEFTGNIPTEIGNLVNLTYLNLKSNKLNGNIPIEIGSLTSLNNLYLSNNQLSGSIPDEIYSLTSLAKLQLNNNQLTGTIPASIGNLTNLTDLYLDYNQFTGEIPAEIGNLTSLKKLYLGDTQLTGSPVTSSNTALLDLRIDGSKFDSLPDLSAIPITTLYIENNKFTFEDIEPNIAIVDRYSPQEKAGTVQNHHVDIGEDYTISANIGGVNNTYQWYKDYEEIVGATSATYNIPSFALSDEGSYFCEIKNTVATALTLTSYNINLTNSGNTQEIGINPTSYNESFLHGYVDTITTITLSNTGGENLTWYANQTFTKADYADHTLPENQLHLSNSVWLTRSTGNLFNAYMGTTAGSNSPINTEWAVGYTSDLSADDYSTWVSNIVDGATHLNEVLSVHLIDEDKYYDIKFTSWSANGAGAGFTATWGTIFPDWLSLSEIADTISASSDSVLTVNIDTANMPVEVYDFDITLYSNDIDEHETVFPVHIDVKSEADEISELFSTPEHFGNMSENFGAAVAIDGNYSVVGVPGTASGVGAHAYVYYYNGTNWEKQAKLTATDGADNDFFAGSVSISDSTIVIGAYADDDGGTNSGSAYVYKEPVGGWVDATESAKLTASDAANTDHFGYSVGISDSTIVIGARNDDDGSSNSGSAYVFTKPISGWSGNLTENAKLTASDATEGDNFGYSVSNLDSTIVVGANRKDNGGIKSGAVYVYEKPVSGWVGSLSQTAKLTASETASYDQFGISVSISDSTIAVGANWDDDGGTNSGSAYIFVEPISGWANMTETAKLTASDATSYNYFGNSVSISDSTVVVGAYSEYYQGSAYVFEKPINGWVTTSNEAAKLTASDGENINWFGDVVAISGNHIVVGDYKDDDNGHESGSAYFFKKPVSNWVADTENQKVTETPFYTNANDEYGTSVAIDGNYAVVGAPNYALEGRAFVMYNNGSVWEQQAVLKSSNVEANCEFGYSVSISGDVIIVGAHNEWKRNKGQGSGAAYVFEKPTGGWTDMTETAELQPSDLYAADHFGYSVSISDSIIVVSSTEDDDGGNKSGSAYVFAEPIGGWTGMVNDEAKLTASDAVASDYFGWSVSISGNNVVVGSVFDDDNLSGSGSSYVFTKPVGGWEDMTETAKLTASNPAVNDYFGWSVDISDSVIVVSSYRHNAYHGTAYVYEMPADGWINTTEDAILSVSDGFDNNFGYSVSISQDNILVGNRLDGENVNGGGSAYIYNKPIDGWISTTESAKILPSDDLGSDKFGTAVALSGNSIIVGAPSDNDNGDGSGSVYFYELIMPVITTQPESQNNVCLNSSVDFSVNGDFIAEYQWQASTDSVTWADITNNATYTNATTKTLTVLVDVSIDSTQYRCMVTNNVGSDISDIVGLIIDTEAPVITSTHNDVVVADDGGWSATLADYTGTVTSTDNCDSSIDITQSPVSGTTISGYTNIVTLTATDDMGNSSQVTFNVAVEDNTPPTVTTKDDFTIYLDADGNVTLIADSVVTSASDNNAIADTILSQSAFDCSNIGTVTKVYVTVTDSLSNEAVDSVNITVEDIVNPILVVQNLTVELDANGNASISLNDVVTSATDNCSVADTTLSKSTFDCLNIGENNISVTLTDASGNETVEIAIITVEDNIDPVLEVRNFTLQLDATGNATLKADSIVTSATDNCTIADTALSVTAFDCSNVGTPVNVTVTLSDVAGNEVEQIAVITVEDNINPVLAVRNFTVQLDADGNATLKADSIVTSATDNCSIADTVLSQTAFDCSNIGTPVNVDVTLTDASGNEVEQIAVITVEDNINPVLTVQNLTVELNADGNATIALSDVVTSATDNCSIADTTLSQSAFDCSNVGTPVNVTITLSDVAGNEVEQIAVITVEDNINPVLAVRNFTVQLDADGNATLKADSVVTSATDNCSIADTTLSKSDFDCSNVGTSVNVDVTLTDASGNSTVGIAMITVEDNINPVLEVHNFTLQLDATGNAILKVNSVVTSATDNCTIADTTLSKSIFDCSNVGTPVNVTITLSDVAGNEVEQIAVITVEDNINPVLAVRNFTVQLDADGNATLKTDSVIISATDNCTIADTTLSQFTFDCSDVETPVNVDVTLTDASGNSTMETVVISVEDNVNPSLAVQNLTVELDADGNATIALSDVVTSATDNCTIADTTLSQSAFDCSDIGTPVNVNVTLTDASGNSTIETVVITVEDNVDPVLVVRNFTVQLDATGNATIVADSLITLATDNCEISDTTLSKSTFDCSNVGIPVNIDVTINDIYGNSTVETAIVTVEDNINPALVVQNPTVELDATGNTSILITDVVITATDNCSISDTTISQTTFDCSNVGTPVNVIVTLTDASGNSTVETVIVTVEDNMAPTITCIDNQTIDLLEGESNYTVSGTELDPSATNDNCGVASIVNSFNNLSTLTNAELPIGTTIITWTITDGSGNVETCSFDVQVNEYVGIGEFTMEDITIYPNPTNNYLYIKNMSNTEIKHIQIFNLVGEKLFDDKNGNLTLDVSALKQGAYILMINNNHVKKFMKK